MIGKKKLLLLLCLCSVRVWAFDVALAVTDLVGNPVSVVAQGEQFLINVTVIGDQQGLGEPVITHLDKLSQVVRQPVSTHITIVNGQQSIMRRYVYKVRLDSSGEYSLGPASYDLGGQVVRSSAITVHVTKEKQRALSAASDPFVLVQVNKPSVALSEQVVVQVHVGHKRPIEQVALEPWAVTNGRVTQIAAPIHEHCFYDGKSWPCITYAYALYPARAGECVVPEIHVYGEREREDARGSFISHFFFGRERERITAHSTPLVIQVAALPRGVPSGTIVGEFSRLDVRVDKQEIDFGTAATLTVTLVGNGDVQLGAPYRIVAPDGLKIYESKTSYALEQPIGFLSRTQEFIVQALRDGVFVIEPPPFVFFNPKKQKIETLAAKKFTLTAKNEALDTLREPVYKKNDMQVHRKWPSIAMFWFVVLVASFVVVLYGCYLVRVFWPSIEKKIACWALRRCVKKVHRMRDARSLHAAWFAFFNKRLRHPDVFVSLREAGKFLDSVARKRWYGYITKLEHLAFQLQDVTPFLDDIIIQTYDWIEIFEDLL